MLVVSSNSKLGCEAGCGQTVLFSNPARIGPALEMTFSCFCEILESFFCVAGAVFGEFVQ